MPAAAGYRIPDRLEEDRDMEDEDDEEEEEGEEDLHLEMDEGENVAKSKVRCKTESLNRIMDKEDDNEKC
jgi:hypothetical protein